MEAFKLGYEKSNCNVNETHSRRGSIQESS